MTGANKNRIRLYKLFAILLVMFAWGKVFANVTLPAIFSDHMVLQQKSQVEFWGWADPGEAISINESWSNATTKINADASGKWKAILKTPSNGGPYTIKIMGKNQIEIKDVLVGEVWVCSGQSNMVSSLKGADNAAAEIAKANFSSIRYFSVKRQYGPQPFDDAPGSVWEKISPQNAGSYSAVAYYFAKKIHQALQVPVGIIYSAWGGTPAEAWTPNDVLQKDTSLSVYITRWKYIRENAGKDSTAYHLAVNEWEKNKKADTTAKIKKPAEPQTFYYFKRPWREPGVLFNGMINPVIPYTIKGVLWYQGESNVGYADEYEHLFGTLIQSWRNRWKVNNTATSLPFYFVQIAPFGYSNMDAAARLRQGQYNITQKLKNTGMAVTVDLGNMKNIHFTHKKEVGDRLALIALAKNYGFKNIVYTGPVVTKAQNINGKVHITFNQRLITTNNKEPGGFEIGYKIPGNDSLQFVKGISTINGNEIIVWNDIVKKPLVVRYAWLEIGEANLINKNRLPAPPFEKKL
jgi:sialate O-acetylesterase